MKIELRNCRALLFLSQVSTSFNEQQLAEIGKILDFIDRMEKIIHTSPNRTQVERVQKELRRMGEKLAAIVPGVNPINVNVEEVRRKIGLLPELGFSEEGANAGSRASTPVSKSSRSAPPQLSIIEKYPIIKPSPHSADPDVNLVYTVLQVIQNEYWPVISDQICKLDFSHAAERDSIRQRLDNVLRSMKVLTETIDEYAQAEKQDFREQLLKMKSRQIRIVLFEMSDFLKVLKDFLAKLIEDIRGNGGVILNKKETIKFDTRFHNATVLEGRAITDGIKEYYMYVDQAIEKIHMPDLK